MVNSNLCARLFLSFIEVADFEVLKHALIQSDDALLIFKDRVTRSNSKVVKEQDTLEILNAVAERADAINWLPFGDFACEQKLYLDLAWIKDYLSPEGLRHLIGKYSSQIRLLRILDPQ